MGIARDHKNTINKRVESNAVFNAALLDEAITLFLNGEPDVARLVLRDLVNETIGFQELAIEIERPSKSLHRMLSARGNPTMDNLTKIISILRDRLDLDIKVHTLPKHEDTIVIAGEIVVSREELVELVQRHNIKHLALFGSAARGQLKPDSDIDLLVEFKKGKAPSLGGMVKLNDELSALFAGRKVDIATPNILNNPYRRRAIEKDMEELYVA